ncbi:hypothetical protein JW752_05500 [Candidatus Peregrinibacteria bacterium]|nr:hypothetical protein [Candidatus Peregrinibacteria bacterium]
MPDQNKKASPELIRRMKNITAQAEAAKHWLNHKHTEESQKKEAAVHNQELAAIEKEINNL